MKLFVVGVSLLIFFGELSCRHQSQSSTTFEEKEIDSESEEKEESILQKKVEPKDETKAETKESSQKVWIELESESKTYKSIIGKNAFGLHGIIDLQTTQPEECQAKSGKLMVRVFAGTKEFSALSNDHFSGLWEINDVQNLKKKKLISEVDHAFKRSMDIYEYIVERQKEVKSEQCQEPMASAVFDAKLTGTSILQSIKTELVSAIQAERLSENDEVPSHTGVRGIFTNVEDEHPVLAIFNDFTEDSDSVLATVITVQ